MNRKPRHPMKLPALSTPRAIIAPRPAARPALVAPKPALRPALATAMPRTVKSNTPPPEIIAAAVEGEYYRDLQNVSKAIYEKDRAKVSEWMEATGTKFFQASGLDPDGNPLTANVTYGSSGRASLDLAKLIEATGLSVSELYDLGILSTTKEAVVKVLGENHVAAAMGPAGGKSQASFKPA